MDPYVALLVLWGWVKEALDLLLPLLACVTLVLVCIALVKYIRKP